MNLLITGGCGFLGCNLAMHAIKEKNYKVTVFDNLSRLGSEANLKWLKNIGDFEYVHGDIRNTNDVDNLVQRGYDVIFHLAGQVAMTTSIMNPRLDFEINALGTFNLLDAVRRFSKDSLITYSSTNKVYGDLESYHYKEMGTRYACEEYPNGFPETIPLDFHSPYGCSKGCSDQYMQDFARIFNLKTIVFRHSSMYGGRQFATYDQGWIGWFCQKAIETLKTPEASFAISGNGKQVRDILNAEDMVTLYFAAIDKHNTMCGHAYNIGGGMQNSLSLLELFTMLENKLNISLNFTHLPPRESDQKVFIADISKVRNDCGWFPKVSASDGIDIMLKWIEGTN